MGAASNHSQKSSWLTRPRARKTARLLLSLYIAVAVAHFFYGIVRFPDSPIKPCGEQHFCGKQGQPRTEVEYHAFNRWNTLMIWSWPLVLVASVGVNRLKNSSA